MRDNFIDIKIIVAVVGLIVASAFAQAASPWGLHSHKDNIVCAKMTPPPWRCK